MKDMTSGDNGSSLQASWDSAKVTYDMHYQELQRVTSVAASLLTAVTLSAALAGPLLVTGIERTLLDGIFGLGLLGYLLCLSNAIGHALRVLYSPLGREPVPGLFNPRNIAARFSTIAEYEEYFRRSTREEQITDLIAQTWVYAQLVNLKVISAKNAAQWTRISLLTLSGLILLRYLTSFLS